MRRRVLSGLLTVALAGLLAAGCEDSGPPTTPSPQPNPTTETFTGVLTLNGAHVFAFNSLTAGNVTATVTGLQPSTAVIGVAIGTSSGTTCQVTLDNPNASLNAAIFGAVTTQGSLCLRVYDSKGQLTEPVNFTVAVEHF